MRKWTFLAFYKSTNVDTYFCSKTFKDFNKMKEFSAKHAKKYKNKAQTFRTYYSTYIKIYDLFM